MWVSLISLQFLLLSKNISPAEHDLAVILPVLYFETKDCRTTWLNTFLFSYFYKILPLRGAPRDTYPTRLVMLELCPLVSDFILNQSESHFRKIASDNTHPLYKRITFNTSRRSSRCHTVLGHWKPKQRNVLTVFSLFIWTISIKKIVIFSFHDFLPL